MKLTCWGAAGTVTGSMHLIETEVGAKILIDCGIYYEKNKDITENNLQFPFDPKSIDAIVLTHAHIDHCGNLPNLIRQGFEGPIYCTAATKELTYHLLEDSLHIQMHDAEKKGVKKKAAGKHIKIRTRDINLLYSFKDIKRTMELMQTLNYNEETGIGFGNLLTFYNAGHILGAASAFMQIQDGILGTKTIGFTGDLGNNNTKLTVNPTPLPAPDFLVTEATYGGRKHQEEKDAKEVLLAHIQQTCVNLNGKLIIPAFSVGRTQAILFTLNQLYQEGRLPQINIYTDSPLAIKTTGLYSLHVDLLNEEAKEFYKKNHQLFEFEQLHTVSNPRHSELVSVGYEPCVIVSAAGMVEGGRIQQHIRNNISNPFSTVLIAGYCADGTLGHLLLQGLSHITVNKKEKPVMAQIKRTDVYSAHLDHDGLVDYIFKTTQDKTKKIFLVHADPFSAQALKADLESHIPTVIAEKGVVYSL
jgi:metallo-beta-lactamase family protein